MGEPDFSSYMEPEAALFNGSFDDDRGFSCSNVFSKPPMTSNVFPSGGNIFSFVLRDGTKVMLDKEGRIIPCT